MGKSKTSLFLMELIIAILVFAIAGAVCVQLFVKAHLLSESTQKLNHAVNLCETGAELFYYTDGDLAGMSRLLCGKEDSTKELSESFLRMDYDSEFLPCEKEDACYVLEVSTNFEAPILTADIRLRDLGSDEVIYALNCKEGVTP